MPVVYYISPQLWAWRRGRLKTMKRVADRVLVIFPFEAPFYEEAGVPVDVRRASAARADRAAGARANRSCAAHGLDPARPVVALLPGSRRNELRAHPAGPGAHGRRRSRRACRRAQFVIARAPHLDDELLAPLADWPAGASRPVVVEGQTDAVLASADVAVVASGTVTVQAALHGCPMVVVYRVGPLTYRLGKPLAPRRHLRDGRISSPGSRVVPELIQDDFTPEAAAAEALRVLTGSRARGAR